MCRAASHVSSRRELEAGSRGLSVGVGSALFSSASRRSKIRAYLAETSAHRGSAFGAAAGAGLAGAGGSRVGVGGATGTGSGACALGGTALVGLPAGELGLEPLPPIVVVFVVTVACPNRIAFCQLSQNQNRKRSPKRRHYPRRDTHANRPSLRTRKDLPRDHHARRTRPANLPPGPRRALHTRRRALVSTQGTRRTQSSPSFFLPSISHGFLGARALRRRARRRGGHRGEHRGCPQGQDRRRVLFRALVRLPPAPS